MIWSALILGLMGSMHCLGMCGPIALIIPVDRSNQFTRYTGSLVYNIGRILVYGLLGMIMGGLGKLIAISGYQQMISIVLGAVIILIVLVGLVLKKRIIRFNPLLNLFNYFKSNLNELIRKKSYTALFSIGMINALLPCGLLYLALVATTTMQGALEGFAYMLVFGIGTLPVMFSIPILGRFLSVSFRNKILKLIPIMMIFFGLLLMLRGMNLGIPILSPEISKTGLVQTCH